MRLVDNHHDRTRTRQLALTETRDYINQEYTELLNGRCPRHPAGAPGCWHTATENELRRSGKAVMLSGGKLAVCEALMRGETVPLERVDQLMMKRLGRR